ncbi:N-acetyltransferase [bacterium]|nr:N-acetyltransferase [bacterium]MBU3956614.1 N-acetyltransferase [bacterium]
MDEKLMELAQVKSLRELKRFIEFPYALYKKDTNWAPPLISETREMFSDKNPFWKHAEKALFTINSSGRTMGRIAAIIDENHNRFHGEKCGFFGFFECVEDAQASRLLFDAALSFMRSRGMKIARGPVNPSTNDECGMLVEGYGEPPKIMMTYNPPYYADFVSAEGFYKAKDLIAFITEVDKVPAKRLRSLSERVLKRNPAIKVRPINVKDFENEVKIIMNIYNAAWEKNWGFVPFTDDEIFYMAGKLRQIVDPELLQIAFCGQDPAGFIMTLPDINEALIKIRGRLTPLGLLKLFYYIKKIKNIRVLTLGVKKRYHQMGIEGLLYSMSLEVALRKGYKKCEFSWVLEDNTMMMRAADMLSGKAYKRYRIFEKTL